MKIDNGGAVYPHGPDHCNEGMSLRDWLAGLAMQGMMDYITAREARETPESTARAAYRMADAMLKARKESTS